MACQLLGRNGGGGGDDDGRGFHGGANGDSHRGCHCDVHCDVHCVDASRLYERIFGLEAFGTHLLEF